MKNFEHLIKSSGHTIYEVAKAGEKIETEPLHYVTLHRIVTGRVEPLQKNYEKVLRAMRSLGIEVPSS